MVPILGDMCAVRQAAVPIRLETTDMTYSRGKTVGDGAIFVAHIARCG